MAKYVIEGGVPLRGSVRIPGAKNAGFKQMIASLLTDDRSTITNIPYIRDVVAVKKIIEALGAKVEFSDDTMEISGGVSTDKVPEELGIKSRASFMYLPVLLHRFKRGTVSLPAGDQIGQRPINWFLDGLRSMGVEIDIEGDIIRASSPNGLKGTEYSFPKNSHTGTEGLILAAVLADGETRIENAAAEPEVDDLTTFLNQMGAKIKRSAERTIEIEGVSSLKGAVHKVMPDRNEVVTFGCMALGTGGEIEIENANPIDVQTFLDKVKETGGSVETSQNKIKIVHSGKLDSTNVATAPHPGFMTDWQSLWAALMTQANGESIVHETIFENRFGYVENLKKMGAKIELFAPQIKNPEEFYNFGSNDRESKQPHAVRISGHTLLQGKKLEVTDIRSGATLVLAALMAQGKSEIIGIEHIERGYENLEGRLEQLGARITRQG
ncbi:MAG: UDP-N-acetylglucosamine 1-carboxyvinyltransferase [Candidatus Woykebacteria bacterium]